MESSTITSRRQRLRAIYAPLAVAAATLLVALWQPWYRFAFAGDVQTSVGGQVVREVSASASLSATQTAAAANSSLLSLPLPATLVALALLAGVLAVATRLWLVAVAALVLVAPLAHSQLGALTFRLEQGPGGHLLERSVGVHTFTLAFWLTVAVLVLAAVAARAVRKAELAAERAAAVAAGIEPQPLLAELVRGAIQARLRLPTPRQPS